MAVEGWLGWDEYARFYDWENARTMGRKDVRFWQDFARREGGPLLELGCGTGRILIPVARTGVRVVGVDRSEPMLAYAGHRARRLPRARRPKMVRADIRALPFPDRSFSAVMAPYGILQSLTRERDLAATLAEAARSASIWCPTCRRGTSTGIAPGCAERSAGPEAMSRSWNRCGRTGEGS